MLATLTLDFKGVQFLQIKADGSHGRTVSSGTRLLFDKERALLAAAFPGKKKVAAKEVRAVFEAHGVPMQRVPAEAQGVSRGDCRRRGEPQRQTVTDQDLKAADESWVGKQLPSFADVSLASLRVVGLPVSAEKVCIAWAARGFLNHLRGFPSNRPLCLTVDGRQRVSAAA